VNPVGRVLIVVHNLPVPHDRRVWLEATTLERAGYDVTVICPATAGFPRRNEILEGVHIRRFRQPANEAGPAGFMIEFAWSFLAVTALVLRLRRRGRFDVLHVCNPPEIYWPLGRLLRRLDGTRFLFDHHDLAPEMYEAKYHHPRPAISRALRWLERMTYRSADRVICTNESYRRIAGARTGTTPDRIQVVRSGPSVERFTLLPPEPGWSKGRKHLLVFLGEIGSQDGVENLIGAVNVLAAQRDDFHVLVIGDGPHLPEIRALTSRCGLDELVTFAGRISDDIELSRMLSSATVGVVPDPDTAWSRHSTMNKVVEYLFFGLPVVAFDLLETRVSAGDGAAYARPDDVASFASVIDGLLDDTERRAELGAIGRRRVLEELSWEHSVGPLLDVYGRLVGAPADG
jgi:glycosyltransferase involved in cell wall biosynthesis